MKSYTLNHASTGATSEINAETDAEAIDKAAQLLGGEPVVADQWDADGVNGDDEPCKRILFWADEDSADNDDGGNAIAELSTTGNA